MALRVMRAMVVGQQPVDGARRRRTALPAQ
jgi:hypothetical protein